MGHAYVCQSCHWITLVQPRIYTNTLRCTYWHTCMRSFAIPLQFEFLWLFLFFKHFNPCGYITTKSNAVNVQVSTEQIFWESWAGFRDDYSTTSHILTIYSLTYTYHQKEEWKNVTVFLMNSKTHLAQWPETYFFIRCSEKAHMVTQVHYKELYMEP